MNRPPVVLSDLVGNTRKRKVLKSVDLFCGAGGTSTAMIGVAEAFTTGKTRRMYNLEVDEDESYVADWIVVHNCTTHPTARLGAREFDH